MVEEMPKSQIKRVAEPELKPRFACCLSSSLSHHSSSWGVGKEAKFPQVTAHTPGDKRTRWEVIRNNEQLGADHRNRQNFWRPLDDTRSYFEISVETLWSVTQDRTILEQSLRFQGHLWLKAEQPSSLRGSGQMQAAQATVLDIELTVLNED